MSTTTTNLKFTPFGVPYVPEFENVSFIPQDRQCSLSSSSSESFCYIETPPPPSTSPFSLQSLFKRKPTPPSHPITKPLPPPPKEPDAAGPHGIFIEFPLEHCHSQMNRKQRLIHLQKTISIAVLDAGMSRSPGNTSHPENHPSNGPSYRTRGHSSPDALFCGTYGQMMAALEAAGLSATPCPDDGLSGHTRLGALFVARNKGVNVQLRKITLWG